MSCALWEQHKGRTGKDILTGFKGRIVGMCHYITGCDQVELMPAVDKEGETRKGEWFDVTRVKLTGAAVLPMDQRPAAPKRKRTPGGPANGPSVRGGRMG